MTEPLSPWKTCTGCGQTFPRTAEYFDRDRSKPDGLRPECKACKRENAQRYRAEHREEILEHQRCYEATHKPEKRERAQRYYAEHREEHREYNRRYRAEHLEESREYARRYWAEHREEMQTNGQRWRAEHREEAIEHTRRWRAEHREEHREYARRYAAEHPEMWRAQRRRRRAREKNAYGTHTSADIQHIYDWQQSRCFYCGASIIQGYHTDHVKPLSRDGSDGPENLVLACQVCNLSKRAKLLEEWITDPVALVRIQLKLVRKNQELKSEYREEKNRGTEQSSDV